jgi:hypothetical protein
MPNWFLRNRLIPLSARRPKFRRLDFGKLCIDCFVDLDKEVASTHFVETLNGRNKYRCHLCWQKTFTDEGRRYLPTVYGGHNFAAATETVPKGNLDDWMYRYFSGNRTLLSPQAICRCCRESVLDDKARRTHGVKIGCWRLLEKCYLELEGKGFCMVCGKWTIEKKNGILLCKPACEEKFKFDNHRWASLEIALSRYRTL